MMRTLLLLILLAFSYRSGAWTTYQNNPSHNGYVAVELNPAAFNLRWQTNVSGQLNPVTIGDGNVFVSTVGYFSGQFLYTLDAADGSIKWSHDFGSIFSVNPPAYFDGKVYIQTGNHGDDTYLRAFDANTGNLVFQSAHGAQWERYLAPTIFEGVVYVNGGYYGGMYAFDAINGTQRWFLSLAQYDQWTPAVNADAAYAFVGGKLTAVDKTSGTILYEIEDPEDSWAGWTVGLAPVIGGLDDILVVNGGRLVRFDLVSKSVAYAISGNFVGQPSVAQGHVYAISSNSLTSRDEATGELQWSWIPESQDTLSGAMIVTDSHVLISGSNTVYAVNLQTHRTDWSYAAGGHLALADGVLYIAGTTGTVTAINVGEPPDQDGDGFSDLQDNCPAVSNPDQIDTDLDGVGDICNDAQDSDNDEWSNTLDNCPTVVNQDQVDSDHDNLGDVCDPYPNQSDNLAVCVGQVGEQGSRLLQLQAENVELKARLTDTDKDGVMDSADKCPATSPSKSIDAAGCSINEFCANIQSKMICTNADWNNDEPINAKDCSWFRSACLAR